ncbi:MAG TPA: S-adenosylmethionine:tRNA ribosyltransferase-isomerase, partial [Nocardioides sp.]|nr:S-adenosylmethionine:tRNA ribosyltransferase-isomerase [Nocardioides sp.]
MSLAATAPPEARGLARDEVRMAVVTSERTHHRQARELPLWLEPGDLLVVNTSATLPSALPGGVHVSAELDDGSWVVELRRADGRGPRLPQPGEVVRQPRT